MSAPMSAMFPDLVRQAAAHRWCVRPYCTTCANHDFRRALESLDDSGERLTAELCSMSLDDYITIPDWDDALRVAFLRLPWPGQRERVLDAWLAEAAAPTRFIDVVLYHIVRHYSDCELRRRWITACIERATATRNGSLTESLLWTLGDSVASARPLLELALQLADTYPAIRKPLTKYYGEPYSTHA